MHYVDEGSGEPIVFVHGNPAWSFEFRHLIGGLRSEFRCVAPDHIGFGLSSRSDRKEDHHPAVHAEAFGALLDDLELRDVTLFLTDWGWTYRPRLRPPASGSREAVDPRQHLALAGEP